MEEHAFPDEPLKHWKEFEEAGNQEIANMLLMELAEDEGVPM